MSGINDLKKRKLFDETWSTESYSVDEDVGSKNLKGGGKWPKSLNLSKLESWS